jgi:hypothetical protein
MKHHFGRAPQHYRIVPAEALALFRRGWDTTKIAEHYNDDIRLRHLPYERVTEAEVYSAIGRARAVLPVASAA